MMSGATINSIKACKRRAYFLVGVPQMIPKLIVPKTVQTLKLKRPIHPSRFLARDVLNGYFDTSTCLLSVSVKWVTTELSVVQQDKAGQKSRFCLSLRKNIVTRKLVDFLALCWKSSSTACCSRAWYPKSRPQGYSTQGTLRRERRRAWTVSGGSD